MTSDENGNYTNAYTYGLDRISVDNLQVENGVKTDPRYYLYDGRGSVSDVINTFGQAKDKYSYDPYGEFSHGGYLGSSGTHYENFYGYNGEDYNRLSGLEYLRARYYEPETGRFLTRDSYLGSIMEPLTLNRYAYAVNNPVMNTDPSGHIPKWLSNVGKKISNAWESTKKVVSKVASSIGSALSSIGKEIKSWVAPINETKNKVKTTAESNVYNYKGSLRDTYQNVVQQSKPAITTRDYPNEVVRANMVSVKNSCEGAQYVKSQKYQYKDKISQGEVKNQMTLPTKIFDMFFPGSFERYENRNNSLYDGVNYWTFGMADTIKGTFNPEKPLSLQHWIDSAMTAFMFLPAMKLAGDGVSALLSKSAASKGVAQAEIKYAYNMIENPGPLAKIDGQPASNFYGGKYNVEVLTEDRIYYRAGQDGKPLGQWFTSEPAESVAKVRIDTAVKEQWIDQVTGEITGTSIIDINYAIKIPKGTTVYTGPVGYQGGVYLGGEDIIQTFIHEPWKLNVEVISKTPLE